MEMTGTQLLEVYEGQAGMVEDSTHDNGHDNSGSPDSSYHDNSHDNNPRG